MTSTNVTIHMPPDSKAKPEALKKVAEDMEGADIEDRDSEVLARKVDFKKYAEAKVISPRDAQVLTDYVDQNAEGKNDLLTERGKDIATAFLTVLSQINQRNDMEYILAVLDDLLWTDRNAVRYFDPATAPAPLLRLLNAERSSGSSYVVQKAASILSVILRDRETPEPEFFAWILARLRDPKDPLLVKAALPALKNILKNPKSHERFAMDGGFRSLMNLTVDMSNTQMQYLVIFCLWLLSFNPAMLAEFKQHQAVNMLVELAKKGPREKVIRVIMATLRNLLNKEDFNDEMVFAGLVKVLYLMNQRKLKDQDLLEDIKAVDNRLEEVVETLSSFDMYQSECNSGRLSWTPVHTADFWRENITKFEDGNYALIQRLINLLDSDDWKVKEVACYDLGEFARFHPDGRMVITKMRGKTKLMSLLGGGKDDKIPESVRKQALLAVQKLMVHNWEQLNSAGGVAALAAKK